MTMDLVSTLLRVAAYFGASRLSKATWGQSEI